MENNFVNGLFWKSAGDKTPAWIKGSISISVDKFQDWLSDNAHHKSEKGWLTIDICEPKNGGNYYFKLNTFKPQPKQERNTMEMYEPTPEELKASSPLGNDYPVEGDDGVINPEDIPF